MTFTDQSQSTRNGFKHVSRLYDDDFNLISEATVHYINRTWEAYQFQTSRGQAVQNAIEREIEKQKQLQGIKRLTKAKQEEIINYSSYINQLKTLVK